MILKAWINNDWAGERHPRRPLTRTEMERAIIDTGYRELAWTIARCERKIVRLKANLA